MMNVVKFTVLSAFLVAWTMLSASSPIAVKGYAVLLPWMSSAVAKTRRRVFAKPTVLFTSSIVSDIERGISTSHDRSSLEESTKATTRNKMKSGLLLSSFTDGLLNNPEAQEFLRRGLLRCLLMEEQERTERTIQESVRFSPCNGPNIDALMRLEHCDQSLQLLADRSAKLSMSLLFPWLHSTTNEDKQEMSAVQQQQPLRFVYIPTAMYAIRSNSTNTPGKQRQRARADAKQRRDDIVTLLHQLLDDDDSTVSKTTPTTESSSITIAAVTLDLDDGSIKHPMESIAGANNKASGNIKFPSNGKQTLQEWNPHFIYIQGGNTFWLYHCLEKGNWISDICNLLQLDTSLYCGVSAGAIVMGASLETACWKEWDDPSIIPHRSTYKDWEGVHGLNLAGDNVAFFPHYSDPEYTELVELRSAELLSRTGIKTDCLRDDQVFYVGDGVQ